MTISKDLFLSILSMDAYNRGYHPGIEGLANAPGTRIGSATILDVDIPICSEPASFYAISYDDATFGRIISYRGTDSTPMGDTTTDATRGWPLGGDDYFTPQTALSIDFLDAGQADSAPGSVVLTGHSLGGGLAGFQARLFGNEAAA